MAGVVPFMLLVRTSVALYRDLALPAPAALAGGALGAALPLVWYGARLSRALTGRVRLRFVTVRLVLPLVAGYCGYALYYLSSVNAKTDHVRAYYATVHPVLRVALGTAILVDRGIVVTDARRVPEDYDRMGLPRYEHSLHFEQPSGWVHALDLRTLRRAPWRNAFVHGYFRLMGFRTLRHVGTADHLHVSLPLR